MTEALANEAWFAHKLNQSELQLDQSQLSYPKHLGPVQQETAQPNITKSPTTIVYFVMVMSALV